METLKFLTREQIDYIAKNFKLPVYVYSEKQLKEYAEHFISMPNAYGHTVRYAMKANSNLNILRLFNKMGIAIDSSSEYEVHRAIFAGIPANQIQLSGQELSENLEQLLNLGIFFVATSINQLEKVGKLYGGKGYKLGVRINPGIGSAAFDKVNTGGVASSFGIWHEKIDEVISIASKYDLKISKIHLHIGSENTPEAWVNTASIGLNFIRSFFDVEILNLGGGFKMAIMPYEKTADISKIGNAVKEKLEDFAKETGRKLKLEVEPGKYLVINSCNVITKIVDIVDTGKDGYKFIKINSGMTEMPRVPMYGVQEPLFIINNSNEKEDYIVVGHCCESGDVVTTKLYDPNIIEKRTLNKASIGDILVIEGTGAYNSSMSMKNYNSFPEAGELLIRENGDIVEIRKREKLEDIWRNEIII